ncbi:hypothetical protein [Epilithonimonas lactis]|uniref:Lipoprotein n=1 Tax=Epilithonimonas lactis TaxID=421072 RepID=A0A085BLT5_9FLAO|nr:hypothetical protein [Epilithonimonas lactis]KFC23430.1 hypothetical protein IO89_02255 [Epilithonimonas lactis]SEQ12919.1 hypothetical protein SAMN04488097_1415 [Epilithonimonas lactis]
MKAAITTTFLSMVIISCNPVGDTISEEKPLDDQLVNTTENIDLKKGDVLVIWGKMDASLLKNDNVPMFELNYNLSLDGKTIDNKSVQMFASNDNIIKSTYEIQKDEEEDEPAEIEFDTSDDTSSENIEYKTVKSNWSFEQEVIKIPIEKDGKYTLDYKASSESESSRSMFTKVAVILRKK